MNTNIVFESNIYPVVGSISTDKEFLSKVWDYNRLCAINGRRYDNVPLSALQRRIIREQPTCSLNKDDPCWGMVKLDNGYYWVSMCTKTECPYFSDCRARIPYDPEKESDFIPVADMPDEYGYKHFLAEYSPAPVLIGDDFEYESALNIKKKTDTFKETVASPFQKLIRYSAELPSDETSPFSVAAIAEESKHIPGDPIIESVDPAPKSTPPAVPEIDLFSPALNVFDYFVECTQEDIIEASSTENFFVDAGPGTGKTYTLIQKLNHMVTDEGVEADGILVLCFTNAAVDEIKSRLRQFVNTGADRSLVNVDVRTFHSFAWWLINQANTVLEDQGWHPVDLQKLSYEDSIICAGNIVSRFGKDVVGNWEYFIVDEVQDLTNALGRFVLKVLDACLSVNCGVTVLGDACQAIYDYEQETKEKVLKSGDFYKALFRKMYGKSKFVYLSENHRQSSGLIQLTSGLRTAILSSDGDKLSQAVSEFERAVEKVPSTGLTINKALLDKVRDGGSVSMLFRNNGQTLKMSSDLRKRGIAHTLNVAETKNNFAPWIADIFGQYKKASIPKDKFLELFEEYTTQNGSEVWERLQKLLHTDNDVLFVRELLDAIAVSKVDDSSLRLDSNENIVVSNIHRSKGREYDCVVLDKSFVDSFSENIPPDEYKTLYVAITRPKKKLLLAPMQDTTGMKVIPIFATKRKRWGKTKAKKLAYLEFNGDKDIRCEMFAHTSQVLFNDIRVGDAVFLKRSLKGGKLEYLLIHEDTENVLGTIGESNPYIQDFISYMKLDGSSYIELPASINDLYVSGIYSQVVDLQYLDLHPEIKAVAPNGVWKWIELVGIGHADYDVY